MTSVAAGYEFAHRDDYEGRRVLPTIKVDADTRNIGEKSFEGGAGLRPATSRARRRKRPRALPNEAWCSEY